MSLTIAWESKAPVCDKCKKKDRWLAYVQNMRDGNNYYVCQCGHEQNEVSDGN